MQVSRLRAKLVISSLLLLFLTACEGVQNLIDRNKPGDTSCPAYTIKIGVLYSALDSEGIEQREGYAFADEDKAGERGRIQGCSYRLIYKDQGAPTDLESLQKAVLELVEEDVVAIIGATSSEATLQAAGIANSLKVPMLVPVETTDDLFQEGNQYIFKISPTDKSFADAAFQLVVEALGTDLGVAVIYEQSIYGESAGVAAGDSALANGLSVVVYGDFATSATNVDNLLLQPLGPNLRVVLVVSTQPSQALTLVRNIKAGHPELAYIIGSGFGFTSRDFLYDAAGMINSGLENLIIAAPWNSDLDPEAFDEFDEKFRDFLKNQKTLVSEPISIRNVQSYSALQLLMDSIAEVLLDGREAYATSGDLRDNLAGAIRSQDKYESMLGLISFLPNGQAKMDAILFQVQDRRLITVYPSGVAVKEPQRLVP